MLANLGSVYFPLSMDDRSDVERFPTRLLSWRTHSTATGIACAVVMVLLGGSTLGQLPGICVPSTDGTWNLSQEPSPANPVSTSAATPSMTSDEVRSFLARTDRKSTPNRIANSVPINRYAVPNSQAPVAMQGVGDRRIPSPHSDPRFQRVSRIDPIPQDDRLLTPNPNEDLLAPMPSENRAPSADPLATMGPDAAAEVQRAQSKAQTPANPTPAIDPHAEVYANDRYPSAIQCAKCHQKIYDEWRVSGHAYAAISPMFQRFEQAVAELTRGTSGTFCVRCHAPVATQTDYPRDAPIFSGPTVFREGITCIACHRVVERYGRNNGERRIETGSLFDPVVGNLGGHGVEHVVSNGDHYKVKLDPNDKRPNQPMHQSAIQFEQLANSSFCAGCHQVLVQPGIALEIVYQQYRAGPACKKGISCQDCHMGIEPGKPLGYSIGPAAEISGKTVTNQRKHANHMFHGPGYPLAHPGLFPHNEKSLRWTVEQWLQFDHRQGWGTESFESALTRGEFAMGFPPAWSVAQERRDARKVIDENQRLLTIKRGSSTQVLENGSRIDGPYFDTSPSTQKDLKVHFVVSNLSEGHNMPSGSLGAQPQLWLNAVLIGPDGTRLWESGHLDSNGDLCDWHSLDVRAGRMPRDSQLVNYQTKFLITNVKGTEREMYLPINVDIDPLPFFRPGTVPYTVLNHPPFLRMEAHSIPPVDSRIAHYTIPKQWIQKPGTYRLSVRLRSRVEPAYFLLFCKGTPDMQRSLNDGIIDVHPYSTEFVVR